MNGPIGIFDSGLGGLTVLREIEQLLPEEELIYLGDTARVPYGVKSADTVTRYSQEICDFLLRQDVKAIVVACNTASALALPKLREWYQVPLLGVLEPGAQAAVAQTRTAQVGVIGTEATIRSESYAKAISRLNPEIQVFSKACPLFVPLVEEGWDHHEITRQIVEIYIGEWRDQDLDTLILGCTHYPLLKDVLGDFFGEKVTLVDSARETAKSLKSLLTEQGLLRQGLDKAPHRYFSTDAPDKMRELSVHFLGHEPGQVEMTDLGVI